VCEVNTRRLQMSDFDSALYLLNSSQADALGTPKVYLSLFITVIYTILLPINWRLTANDNLLNIESSAMQHMWHAVLAGIMCVMRCWLAT